MKTLKFESKLADMILSGEKTSTWRMFDEKGLFVGDKIEFIRRPELVVFASALITDITEKTVGKIDNLDYVGHEKFNSPNEMMKTYSAYYARPIDKRTKMKIIKFKLLNRERK